MCDTVVVVREDGVLFAKNSDRDANEAQLLEWRPRAEHPEGASVRCTWLAIPEARRTHAVLLSRPFWIWGAEMGANEHGVAIGNEAVFTREKPGDPALLGMDLLRLALERGKTAEEAVQTIVSLLERHGQGGPAGLEDRGFTYDNAFLVADPHGAFVVETAGRRWAVEEVKRGARSISNALTIPGFAEACSDRLRTTVAQGRIRQARTCALATDATSERDLFRLLRDHGDGRIVPRYRLVNGAMAAPCMHGGGAIASSQTVGSWVARLSSDCRHWVTATAAPCTSLFKPVRVGEPLDLGPAPTDRFDERALFWRHERFHRLVTKDPERAFPLFAAERDETEQRWLASPPEPRAAFHEAEHLLARWLGRVSSTIAADRRPPWTRWYWRKRDDDAALRPVQ